MGDEPGGPRTEVKVLNGAEIHSLEVACSGVESLVVELC